MLCPSALLSPQTRVSYQMSPVFLELRYSLVVCMCLFACAKRQESGSGLER